ncbi:ribonuclease H-like domain-containing protein [Cladochytrium replicatum]|nr:ribonuclease H-like domain-containing protein [Cladochytrium replicatum]
MTGLDIDRDHIIEIACLLTDGKLKQVIKGPHIVIHQPKRVLDGMDEWCTKHHGKSGLTEAVLASTVTTAQAEQTVLEFIKQYVQKPRVAVLAGNSVHMDLVFLRREMPSVVEHLHYRIVDVSSVKEMCRRFAPLLLANSPQKNLSHRALDDILESIEELRYFSKHLFEDADTRFENTQTCTSETQ